MKKENPYRKLLGLSQQDMAMLLGITRARWSMFEIGKRDLPIKAKTLLADMLAHLEAAETKGTSSSQSKQQQSEKKELLEKLKKENKYQQLKTARKVTTVTKKHDARLKIESLTAFFHSKSNAKHGVSGEFWNMIARKANQKTDQGIGEELFRLQLQLEVLRQEAILLEGF